MQKSNKWLLAVVIVLMLPLTVQGQQYERFRLPEGTRIEYQDETYQGFNLGEYRELLRMDADLRQLTESRDAHISQVAELTRMVTQLEEGVALVQDSIEILQGERDHLRALWKEENRLRNIAEQRTTLDWLPWTLSGVLAVVVVVLGVVVGVM